MRASTSRTYRLRAGTVEMLDEAAARLGVSQSRLVDVLLEFALEAEASAQIVVVRRPTVFEVERVYSEG